MDVSKKRYENSISFSLIALFVGALIVQRVFFVGDNTVEISDAGSTALPTAAETVVVSDMGDDVNPFTAVEELVSIEPATGEDMSEFISEVKKSPMTNDVPDTQSHKIGGGFNFGEPIEGSVTATDVLDVEADKTIEQ